MAVPDSRFDTPGSWALDHLQALAAIWGRVKLSKRRNLRGEGRLRLHHSRQRIVAGMDPPPVPELVVFLETAPMALQAPNF